MIKNLIINLLISISLFTGAATIEKWAPEKLKEQVIEKKEKNREDYKNMIEAKSAKKEANEDNS